MRLLPVLSLCWNVLLIIHPTLAVGHLTPTNGSGCDAVWSELAIANEWRHQQALKRMKQAFEQMLHKKDDEIKALRVKCERGNRPSYALSLPTDASRPSYALSLSTDASRAAPRSLNVRRRSSDPPWASQECRDVSSLTLVNAAKKLAIPILDNYTCKAVRLEGHCNLKKEVKALCPLSCDACPRPRQIPATACISSENFCLSTTAECSDADLKCSATIVTEEQCREAAAQLALGGREGVRHLKSLHGPYGCFLAPDTNVYFNEIGSHKFQEMRALCSAQAAAAWQLPESKLETVTACGQIRQYNVYDINVSQFEFAMVELSKMEHLAPFALRLSAGSSTLSGVEVGLSSKNSDVVDFALLGKPDSDGFAKSTLYLARTHLRFSNIRNLCLQGMRLHNGASKEMGGAVEVKVIGTAKMKEAHVRMWHCEIRNSQSNYGGGCHVQAVSSKVQVVIFDCQISNNTALYGGGGYFEAVRNQKGLKLM